NLEQCRSWAIVRIVTPRNNPGYRQPSQTFPVKPPATCAHIFNNFCRSCIAYQSWKASYNRKVDDIVLRSNVHTCHAKPRCVRPKTRGSKAHQASVKGCLDENGISMILGVGSL
ncbi:hypothetical protein Hypma_009694, partial [Hypsizygus marmoreus]